MNFKNNNEKIINFINNEYIKGSFLFNRRLMQRSLYIFMIAKLGLSNMPLS
jgi:hypothetical protein